MLVFTRRLDEAIVIGDGIEIKVLRVGRDGVRIGVTAPADVSVHRHEVYDAIRRANADAAANADQAEALVEQWRRAASSANVPTASGTPAAPHTESANRAS